MSIPTHEYETVTGTEPAASGQHEPRTVKHTTTGEEADVYMMYEIGDGVFVQFRDCRACKNPISTCSCKDGPKEPDYAKPWRERRFDRTFNERPDPSYDLIPNLVSWLRERGYTVTKKKEKAVAEVEVADEPGPSPAETTKCRTCGEPYNGLGDGYDGECGDCADKSYAKDQDEKIIRKFNDDEGVDPDRVDDGLDTALERVRAAKEDDVGF